MLYIYQRAIWTIWLSFNIYLYIPRCCTKKLRDTNSHKPSKGIIWIIIHAILEFIFNTANNVPLNWNIIAIPWCYFFSYGTKTIFKRNCKMSTVQRNFHILQVSGNPNENQCWQYGKYIWIYLKGKIHSPMFRDSRNKQIKSVSYATPDTIHSSVYFLS